jgi:hypothetical protein
MFQLLPQNSIAFEAFSQDELRYVLPQKLRASQLFTDAEIVEIVSALARCRDAQHLEIIEWD